MRCGVEDEGGPTGPGTHTLGAVMAAASYAELEQRIRDLETRLAHVEGAATAAAEPSPPRRISRRMLLAAMPAAAVAGVATGARPAAAAAGSPLLLGKDNDAGSATTTLTSTADAALTLPSNDQDRPTTTTISGSRVEVGGDDIAIGPRTTIGPGTIRMVRYDGNQLPLDDVAVDIRLSTTDFFGVQNASLVMRRNGPTLTVQGASGGGRDDDGTTAIDAISVGQPAMVARGRSGASPGTGLIASAETTGTGVRAISVGGRAIDAFTTDAAATADAATVTVAGLGRALLGSATNPDNNVGTVTGENRGRGAGVWGQQRNPGNAEAAVVGWAEGTGGRGGRFRGQAAQVRLTPGLAATHPASGLAGDLYVDRTNRLWFCSGTTTWTQLA